ncbi:MAG TPA: response regulator [Pyrinomonadaceae bacterium]|jgi:two-component system OmpR family response regulator
MCKASQNKRILVVDDLESEIIVMSLRHFGGYVADAALSAEEALALVAKQHYDLFLLDGSMPKMDGFTLAGELRARGHSQPIIFVTAHMDNITRPHAAHVGASGVIEKPFDPQLLIDRVSAALNSGDAIASSDTVM